nr:hypothetical protein [uncultured Hyphomonas sp.]
MPTDITQPSPWHGVPVEQVRQGFAEYIKTSEYPEDFLGVAHDAKPPKGGKIVIIHKDVTVSPGARLRLSKDPDNPSDCYVPCNLCGPAPKFKNNGYAILCGNGWIYFVGHDCAMAHYEGQFADAKKIFDRETAERRAQEYFYENAGRIPAMVKYAQELLEIAEAYAPAHREIRRVPAFVKAMRQAIRDGGWLQVARLEQVQLADGSTMSREVIENIARVTGATAVRAEFEIDSALHSNILFLEGFGDTEEAVLEGVMATHESGKLPELHSAVLRAMGKVNEARDSLVQFRQFFQPGNLENIRSWLRQPDCPIECRAENDGRTWWFRVLSTQKRRKIDTRVFDAPIPKLAEGKLP